MQKKSAISILALNIFIIFSTMMGLFPLAPEIVKDLKMSSSEFGLIVGLASLIMTALAIPSGVFADRFGRRGLIIGAMILSTIGLAIVSQAYTKSIFITGWMLFGFARGILITPSFAVVADIFEPQERGKAMGIVSGAIGAGSVAGYLIAGLVGNYSDWHTSLTVFVVFMIIGTLISFILKETGSKNLSTSIPKAFANSFKWLSFGDIMLASIVGTFCFMVGVYASFLVPFTAKSNGLSLALVSFLLIPYEVVASIGSVAMGWLSDKIGRKIPLLLSLVISIAALIALSSFNFSLSLIVFGYAALGLTEGPIITVVNSIIADTAMSVNPREMASAFGVFRTLQGVGIALGPMLGGYFLTNFGAHRSYSFGAAILVIMAILSLGLKERQIVGADAND